MHTSSLNTTPTPASLAREFASRHSTTRSRTPYPHCSAADVDGLRQLLHSPTDHTTWSVGHGNRLQGVDVGGGGRLASTHSWLATLVVLRVHMSIMTHVGGDDVDTPSTCGSVVMVLLPAPRLSHGAEQALQSEAGTHDKIEQGCRLHDC